MITSSNSLFPPLSPLSPELGSPLTPVSGQLTPSSVSSSSSDESERDSVTPKAVDSDRETPPLALTPFSHQASPLSSSLPTPKAKRVSLKGNCEVVNIILKKRGYILPAHPQTEEEVALFEAAKTISELRIEACNLRENINVHEIDRDPKLTTISERVKSGELCAQIATKKFRSLAAWFTNVKQLKIYFGSLGSVHMQGLTVFKQLQHLDLRFCKVAPTTLFDPLKKLDKLETVSLSHGYRIPVEIDLKIGDFADFLKYRAELSGNGQKVSRILKDAWYEIEEVSDIYLDAMKEIAPTIRDLYLEGQFHYEITADDVHKVEDYDLHEGDIVDLRMRPLIGKCLGLINLEKNTLRGQLDADRISELWETFKNVSKIELYLTEIDTDHLVALDNFAGLEVLEFRSCTFKNPEALRLLSEMHSLRTVRFIWCEGINDLALSELRQASQLTHLEINSLVESVSKEGVKWPISDTGVAFLFNLANLEYLDISCSPITDSTLLNMGRFFKQLKVLIVKDSWNITQAGVDAVRSSIPGLQRLDTSGCRRLPLAQSSVSAAPRKDKHEEKKTA